MTKQSLFEIRDITRARSGKSTFVGQMGSWLHIFLTWSLVENLSWYPCGYNLPLRKSWALSTTRFLKRACYSTLLGAFLGIKPPAAAAPAAAHMVASDRQGTSSGADMETKAIITVQIELHDSIGSAVISLLKAVLVSSAVLIVIARTLILIFVLDAI